MRLESAENAASQAHELLRTLCSAFACQDITPNNSESNSCSRGIPMYYKLAENDVWPNTYAVEVST
jgi:hypothetical protein